MRFVFTKQRRGVEDVGRYRSHMAWGSCPRCVGNHGWPPRLRPNWVVDSSPQAVSPIPVNVRAEAGVRVIEA